MRLIKTVGLMVALLAITGSFAATTVFWQDAVKNGYNLQANPGPAIVAGATVDQGSIVVGCRTASNQDYWQFLLGNGDIKYTPKVPLGWSPYVWVRNLKNYKGTITSAKVRGEYFDYYNAYPRCVAGSLKVRMGVVDYGPNIALYGSEDGMAANYNNPGVGAWQRNDGLFMAYDMVLDGAEEIVTLTMLDGVTNSADDNGSVLGKKFLTIDVTKQVQWILDQNAAGVNKNYAIVFLVDISDAGTGLAAAYSMGLGTAPDAFYYWTKDKNTMHLVVDGSLSPAATEKATELSASGVGCGVYPTPCNPSSKISYSTGSIGFGELRVFTAAGREVMRETVTGHGSKIFDGAKLTSGLYFVSLKAGSTVVTRRLVLLK